MQDEPAVQVKNAQLTLASVRADIVLETEVLSEIHKTKNKLLDDIEKAQAELQAEREEIAKARLELADERNRQKEEQRIAQAAIVHAKEELRTVKRQISEAMSELRKINDWVLAAEEKKKELDAILLQLPEKSAERETLQGILDGLNEEIEKAREAYAQVRTESSLTLDEAEARLKTLSEEAIRAVEARDEAILTRQLEEIKIRDFRDYLVNLKKDTDIIVDRIEDAYGKAYPGLRMKI